jgi:hypothetical protein
MFAQRADDIGRRMRFNRRRMPAASPTILDYELAVARRTAAALGTLPPTEQERIALVVFTVGTAHEDPRHPVIRVAAGTSVAADGPWAPGELAHPDLATLGDPRADADLAGLWRAVWERDRIRVFDAGAAPEMRQHVLASLPSTAAKLRTRLRRRAHLRDDLVLLVLTDRLKDDQCVLVTHQMNPDPIPLMAEALVAGGEPGFHGPRERDEVIEYARALVARIVDGRLAPVDGAKRLMFADQLGALTAADMAIVTRYWELAHDALNGGDPAAAIVAHSRVALERWR